WPGAPAWLVSWLAGITVIFLAAAGIFVLAQGVVQMVSQGPALLDRIDHLVQSTSASLGLAGPPHLNALVGRLDVAKVASSILSGVQGVGGTVILVVIYFAYMLAGRRRISRKFDLIGTAPSRLVERAAADIRTYLWVQTVTGLMITAAATAAMLAVGLN